MFLKQFDTDPLQSQLEAAWQATYRGAPAEALARADQVRIDAETGGFFRAAACAGSHASWSCFQLGEIDRGLETVLTTEALCRSGGDVAGQAWARAMHAWLLVELGLMDPALDDAHAAMALAEHAGDEAVLCFATNVVGLAFWYCKQLDRALEFCRRAVAMARAIDDPYMLTCILINLAGVHGEMAHEAERSGNRSARRENATLALAINAEAMERAEQADDPWARHLAYCNAAEYAATDERPEALSYVDRCAALPDLGQRSKAHLLYTRSQILLRTGQFEAALPVCEAAVAMAERNRNAESTTYALRYLSEALEGLGRFEAALAAFKRFHAAEARLAHENIQRHACVMEIRYQTDKLRALFKAETQRADELALTVLRDPLTDIANRRHFDQALAEAGDAGIAFAIAIVDLDHFKAINDRFSHPVGDAVLKSIAATLRAACGEGPLPARLGGEEFALLFTGPAVGTAQAFCRTILRRLASTDWALLHPDLTVTASIGLATSDEAGSPDATIRLADSRLYAAKLAGRNRLVSGSRHATAA